MSVQIPINGLNTLGFIQENSLTYTEIIADLQNFVDALSEDEKLGFKTLFEGTNSKILMEMIAAKQSDEIYHIITSRSENLMYYLNRLDSAIAIAQNSSYSVYRGSNIKLGLTLTPDETIVLPKFSTIATTEEYNIVVDKEYELVQGEQIYIECYLGNVKEQELTATTEDLLVFRFTNQNVSEQIALFLNNNEVPITKNIIEMLDDKYFCVTNAYNSVDVIYLNKNKEFTHRYTNGSKLLLKYIEYQNITLNSIDIQSVYGEISDVKQLSNTIKPETIQSVRNRALLYAETQNRIVARDDFAKVFEISNPEIIDADGQDYDNSRVEVTYIKNNGELLSDIEYQAAYDNLYRRRGYGIPMCLLSHPDIMLNLNIIVLLQLTQANSPTISSYVRQVLSKYELKLGQTINFSDIEHDLESFNFVKVARILPDYKNFSASEKAPEGTTFIPTEPNGKLYIVRNPLFLTGKQAPSWSTEIGSKTTDNDIIWQCEAKSYAPHPNWTAETPIRKENIVWSPTLTSVQFKCVGYTYKTGLTEPKWPTVEGQYVEDNQILWIAIKKNVTAKNWQQSTITEKGDIVNSTVSTSLSYQAINYIPTTPSTEPLWKTNSSLFTDKNIQYAVINQTFNDDKPEESNIKLNWNQYVKFNETIRIV